MKRCLLALLLLCTLPSHADELGRLFYTPQQRQQLDAHDGSISAGPQRNYIIVNGMVQKNGGKRTIWVNGRVQDAGAANVAAPASVPVNIPGKPHPVQLKVGERLMLEAPPPQEAE